MWNVETTVWNIFMENVWDLVNKLSFNSWGSIVLIKLQISVWHHRTWAIGLSNPVHSFEDEGEEPMLEPLLNEHLQSFRISKLVNEPEIKKFLLLIN